MCTQTFNEYIGLIGLKTFGQYNGRRCNMVQAICGAAFVADKMNVVIMVMPFGTIIFTQGIPD